MGFKGANKHQLVQMKERDIPSVGSGIRKNITTVLCMCSPSVFTQH